MCSEANEARFDPGWVLLAMNQELAAVISKGPTRPGRVRLACFAPMHFDRAMAFAERVQTEHDNQF